MRGDIAGLGAVKINLALGQSDHLTTVAVETGKAISELLEAMKAKAVQASQEGLAWTSRQFSPTN